MIQGGGKKEYFFISGSDQYNPNIYSLIDNGKEKVWKDYSIAQQLALHNFYVRNRDSLEYFIPPKWIHNKIFFYEKLQYNFLSATKVRLSKNEKELFAICPYSVSNKIIEKRLWSYNIAH